MKAVYLISLDKSPKTQRAKPGKSISVQIVDWSTFKG